jgi:hypothetical protein
VNSNGYFLYQYSGQDIYSCASWTNVGMRHPLIEQMQEEAIKFLKSQLPVVGVVGNESSSSK